jgi:hypothetical protein
MGKLFKFIGLAAALALAIFLAVVTGDYGAWYFAWLVGTTMIVLIAAAAAVMFDAQEANSNGKV